MRFKTLEQCITFLEQKRQLVRIPFMVDPCLEMAEITRRVFEAGGPAILFEKVKSSPFPAVSNLFGTYDRCLSIFEPELDNIRALVDVRSDPFCAVKNLKTGFKAARAMVNALPVKKSRAPVTACTTTVGRLPQVKCWPDDGGAFILLPQVFSMDPDKPGILHSNLGMYRIQISGNDYTPDEQIGLHYQLHRGIADHHKKAMEKNMPLKVSIFIGGPLAHTLAAVMPLPEGMPEIAFAGALGGTGFRYTHHNGYILSADADFCITGTLVPHQTRTEGPFGDHLGYYSLAHAFPFIQVDNVFHKKNAIYPFTVVGRPPMEDSNFGRLIHEMTRKAVQDTIPGVTAVHAVDAAGVHPLLLAKARERYVPFEPRKPREILTAAHAILGTGQLSLAKYLMICAHEDCPELDIGSREDFFTHFLKRIDLSSGLHFITRTTMDTLDYSHGPLNEGSKVIMAAAGEPVRKLSAVIFKDIAVTSGFSDPTMVIPGIMVIQGPAFKDYATSGNQMNRLADCLGDQEVISGFPLCVVVDDARFCARTFDNFLWCTFTRSNPSHDIYGARSTMAHKHWSCRVPMVIDARIKPFHPRPLVPDPDVARKVDQMGARGGPLYKII